MFRDNPVGRVCLRCGERLPRLETGRPRQYCGDACRQAGSRLFRRRGYGWWKQQDWYPGWLAERQAWHEKWERERPERERKDEEARQKRQERERAAADQRALIESMPSAVRKSYEVAEAAQVEKWNLGTLRLQLETIAVENEELLRATGHQIKLIDGTRKLDRLLHDALYAENEHEALALFAKARQLRAAGEDLDDPPTARELLSQFLRSV